MNMLLTIKSIPVHYTLTCLILILLFLPTSVLAKEQSMQICQDDRQYTMRQLAGEQFDNICETYKDKLILVVNTASKCGYTDQYDELEKLYREYKSRGLVVIGFPSNQFGGQEPGTEKKIKTFCRLTYGVKFPMYAKTQVIGKNATPFYQQLAKASGEKPQWNFHKYLIDRQGKLIGSYKSHINPYHRSIVKMIENNL